MSDEPAKKNDIDFDELDKAVNSLMGSVASETLEDSEKTKTLDVSTTLKDGEKPIYDALGKAAESIGNESLVTDGEVELVEDLSKLPDEMQLPDLEAKKPEESAPQPVETEAGEAPVVETAEDKPAPVLKPAVKRPNNGRFMDMVHPKADMRTAPPLPDLVVPSRPGVVKPIAPPVAVAAATPPAPKVELDVQEQPAPEPEIPQTPFLADAKVEKRPLGSSQPTGTIITVATEESIHPTDEIDGADTLNTDVTETQTINSEHDKKDDGSGDEQRALNASDFEKQSSTDEALSRIESSEAKSASEAPTIEKVESGDTEDLKAPKKPTYDEATAAKDPTATPATAAIYDTKEYHQPISHPPKKKSGWGTVFIIIVIIILAVAVAGGAYLIFVQH